MVWVSALCLGELGDRSGEAGDAGCLLEGVSLSNASCCQCSPCQAMRWEARGEELQVLPRAFLQNTLQKAVPKGVCALEPPSPVLAWPLEPAEHIGLYFTLKNHPEPGCN